MSWLRKSRLNPIFNKTLVPHKFPLPLFYDRGSSRNSRSAKNLAFGEKKIYIKLGGKSECHKKVVEF